MIPYAIVAILLGIAAVAGAVRPSRPVQVLCLAMLIAFVGLRYQLGYDWLGYERLFDFVPGDFDFSEYGLSWFVLRTEPLFYGFNVIVKSLGGSFEILLFILATLNLIVIDKMCSRISAGSQPFVWLVYFCTAMLLVQFNIIRQAAASSFVILSLLALERRRYTWSAILLGLGALIQVSVLMFLPIYALYSIRPRWTYIYAAVGLGLALFVSGIFIGASALEAAGSLLPEFIGSKTDNYIEAFATGGALATISPLAMALALVYCIMLFEFMRFPDDGPVRIAIYLTILVLFAHTALGQFPSVWNRLMCVSLPWQLAALWRTGLIQSMRVGRRCAAVASIAAIGTGVLAYQLGREESLVFVPYHSLVQVWAFGDEGNGRQRAEDMFRRANLPH